MAETRIYEVKNGETVTLVEAATVRQAINHIAGKSITAEVCRAKDALKAMAEGVKFEVAGDE